jgi:hypothetical protein
MYKPGWPLDEFLPPPFVVRRGRVRVTYRSRWRTLLATLLVIAGVITVGVLLDLVVVAAVVGALVALFWIVSTVRALWGAPLLYGGGGGPGLPGGGVREPRRPRPLSPAGAAAIPLPEDDEPPVR